LERVEGVSQKSLAAILSGLEHEGLVRRSIAAQVPIKLDYEATARGHELIVKFQTF
jgi:DNA-binding HxlR family transcriptional regulator